jgi:multidrug resistance efflux pump
MQRKIRIVIGLGVAGAAVWLGTAWLLTPGLLVVKSTRAVVNARILTLYSPIEGALTGSPPPVGKAVSAGSELLEVENVLVDDSHLEELKTEAASLAERVSALKVQQDALETFKAQLDTEAHHYHDAAVKRLESQVAEAQSVAAAAGAFLKQRTYKREQMARLVGGNNVSQLEMVTAELALEAAQNKAAQAQSVARRLAQELDAVRSNSFAGLADARNDVPYSEQRAHDIILREQETAAHIQEYAARSRQIQKQVKLEDERVRRNARFRLRAPIDGIVWRQPVSGGTTITRQTELLQLLDTSDVFVDALVDERYFGDIQPGDRVVIKWIGSRAQVPGFVREVLGKVVAGENGALVAETLRPRRNEIRLLVSFENRPASADHFHPYHIGQPAKVQFPEVGIVRRLKDWVSHD